LEKTVAEITRNLNIDTIQLSCPADLTETTIALSERAMELTMWELMENSKKFHPQHSPQIEIQVSGNNNDMVTLTVLDDGVGLSPEQLAQIWTPYYQADKYATGEIEGMGLGLAMVSSMVREVGGEYHAYNQTGSNGLVVELRLPVVKP
jgi:two-component system cell cycle response regulator